MSRFIGAVLAVLFLLPVVAPAAHAAPARASGSDNLSCNAAR